MRAFAVHVNNIVNSVLRIYMMIVHVDTSAQNFFSSKRGWAYSPMASKGTYD